MSSPVAVLPRRGRVRPFAPDLIYQIDPIQRSLAASASFEFNESARYRAIRALLGRNRVVLR